MKNILFFIAFLVVSCSTISTNKNILVSIKSNAPEAVVKINDSTYQLPAKIWLNRSNKDIPLELKSGAITKNYQLQPSVNYKFVFGNLLFFHLAPVAYVVDCTNSKRFAYQSNAFLDINDSIGIIKTPMAKNFTKFKNHFTKEYPVQKGQTNLVASLPAYNTLNFRPKGEDPKNYVGIGGIAIGVEHFYSPKKYLAASIKATLFNDLDPIGFLGESFGSYDYEEFYSLSFNLTHNHKINRFYLGYGLNWTNNIWIRKTYTEEDFGDGIYTYSKKVNNLLGLSLNGSYQISKYLFLGCSYNQSFLDLNHISTPLYENVFSVDLSFKLPLNKKRASFIDLLNKKKPQLLVASFGK